MYKIEYGVIVVRMACLYRFIGVTSSRNPLERSSCCRAEYNKSPRLRLDVDVVEERVTYLSVHISNMDTGKTDLKKVVRLETTTATPVTSGIVGVVHNSV